MDARRATFDAIGTRWSIETTDPLTDDTWALLLGKVHTRINAFDTAYSRFRPDSLVTRMAHKAGTYQLPQDGYKLLQWYERLYELTDGKVTPLIGQTMVDAGYDAAYTLRAKQLTTPPAWHDVISYDQSSITLRQPALLDFGAAGKGYLVDIISDMLTATGLTSYLINAGGDIVHRSKANKAITVGLEHPYDTDEVIGITQLNNQSLCASAGNKRTWDSYHHIIDPIERVSVEVVQATWVIADDTMTADGLATALFFVTPHKLRQIPFSYALLQSDMSLIRSADFPVELFEVAR